MVSINVWSVKIILTMKKLLIISFATLLLVCCNEKLTVNEIPDSTANGHYVPLDQALDELDEFLSALNVCTKADGVTRQYSKEGVQTVRSEDVFVGTRGGSGNEDIPDDIFYIVNFDDGLGGAVLSADDRTSDIVLCVTEGGSFSVSDFIAASEFLNSNRTNTVSVKSGGEDGDDYDDDEDYDEDGDDDYFEDMGELTVPVLLLSSFEGSVNSHLDFWMPVDDSDSDRIGGGGSGGSSSATKYGPYTTTKWGQDEIGGVSVFNRYTPNNARAGCVVIAVAQILLATKPESYVFTYDGCDCTFGTMMTVANYKNPDDPGTEDAQVQAGKFVRGLGEEKYCNINYGDKEKDPSSGTISSAKRALELFGYSGLKLFDFDIDYAASQIRSEYPLFIVGYLSDRVTGHAWIIDGEWGDYFHINWGWNGRSDGYFTKGVFTCNDRASYDTTIDGKTHTYDLEEYVFSWGFEMITYSE